MPKSNAYTKLTNSSLHLVTLTIATLFILTITLLILTPSLHFILPISRHAHHHHHHHHIQTEYTTPKTYYDSPALQYFRSSQHHNQEPSEQPPPPPPEEEEEEEEEGKKEPKERKTWESLLIPPSGGGIRITPSTILDPSPQKTASNNHKVGHGIAMFHQLHCLIVLRGLIFPDTSADVVNSTSQSHHVHGRVEDDLEHWAHCFDYIAQAVICAADDTIERTKKVVTPEKTFWHVDGVGAVHQCRDARALWEISMRADREAVDMASWTDQGVREFFAEELKTPYQYDIPDIYFLGNQEL